MLYCVLFVYCYCIYYPNRPFVTHSIQGLSMTAEPKGRLSLHSIPSSQKQIRLSGSLVLRSMFILPAVNATKFIQTSWLNVSVPFSSSPFISPNNPSSFITSRSAWADTDNRRCLLVFRMLAITQDG